LIKHTMRCLRLGTDVGTLSLFFTVFAISVANLILLLQIQKENAYFCRKEVKYGNTQRVRKRR
ncbi:MAG: hypothetical protein IJX29_06355, partial [Bacteroides sp.]|nr:hypothetical protein [Bacteroides sp.]